MAKIVYQNETVIDDSSNRSILQISLSNGIAHTRACGGKARCSTCRVLVLEHPENLSSRNPAEEELAANKKFSENIRLACQTSVIGDVTIRRLVIDECDQLLIHAEREFAISRLARVAILFSDIRNFTSFSEANLPYDIVHILNRYFYHMGEIVLKNQGSIDKYIGDGMMAIFGLESDNATETCLNAVRAAQQMNQQLQRDNAYLKQYFDVEFQIGIGIHFGEAVIGEMGHPEKMNFTAIGDSVNLASRIESANKECQTSILISQETYQQVKDLVSIGREFQAQIKGKSGSYKLYEVLSEGV
jgi:adenylate cyclase